MKKVFNVRFSCHVGSVLFPAGKALLTPVSLAPSLQFVTVLPEQRVHPSIPHTAADITLHLINSCPENANPCCHSSLLFRPTILITLPPNMFSIGFIV